MMFRTTALLLAVATSATALSGETRTWTSKSGKTFTAELVAVQDGNVVLRQADGTQLTVPIKQLIPADRELVEVKPAHGTKRASNRPDAEFAKIAEQFFTDLRNEKRDAASESLTKKAQALAKGDKSPLAGLPAPDEGNRSIRVGRAKLDGKVAEVPVQVRAAGQTHKTKLHLRQEEDQWRIFAMSAMYPDGEKSINFEAEPAKEGEGDADPLAALVGKPFEFVGMTMDGKPLDPSRYQGKVVLFDFWATWCGPCRVEMSNVAANYQKHVNDGFDVVAVSVDQDLEALSKFVKQEKPPWAIVADVMAGDRNSMAAKYGIRSIPALILIDRDGKVAAVNCRGKLLGETLDKLFAPGGRKVGSLEGKLQR